MTAGQRKIAWFASIALLGAAVVAGAREWSAAQPGGHEPPDAEAPQGRLVDFPCVERSGKPMRTADLAGQFVLADFVFTSCSAMCPRLAVQMKTVQDDPATRDVRLASFTVDPERDDLARMAAYADEHGFDRARWLFVRSDLGDLKKLMVDELHLAASTDIVLHTDRFVLFDPAGAAVGIYRPLDDPAWRAKLAADLGRLRPAAH